MTRSRLLTPIHYLITAAVLALWGCSGPDSDPDPETFAVAGTLSGLNGTLELSLKSQNKNEPLTLNDNSPFAFTTRLESGSDVTVTIESQPTEQSCTFTSSDSSTLSGQINGQDLTAAIVCVNKAFSVSVQVKGLNAGNELSLGLNDNNEDTLTFSSNTTRAFSQPLETNEPFIIKFITTQYPFGQFCSFDDTANFDEDGDAIGVIGSADVTVDVTCINRNFGIDVSLTGLDAGNSMTVTLNDTTEDLLFDTNGTLSFNTQLITGSDVDLTFSQTRADPQTCVFKASNSEQFEGTIGGTDLAVAIECTPTFTLSGDLSGALDTTGFSVQLYRSGALVETLDDLVKDARFAFESRLDSNSEYRVIVANPPQHQLCSVTNGSGTLTGHVADIAIQCLAWGNAEHLDTTPSRVVPNAQLAMNKNGQATTIWLTNETVSGPADIREMSYPDETTGLWSASSLINQPGQALGDPATANPFSLAMNDNGDSLAVWEPSRYNLRADFGDWSVDALNVTDSAGNSGNLSKIIHPKVVLNDDPLQPQAFLVWTESESSFNNGTFTIKTRFYANTYSWPTLTWGNPERLNLTESVDTVGLVQRPANIASNDNGQALAIWSVLSAEGAQVETALYQQGVEPGTEWQRPEQPLWISTDQSLATPSRYPRPKVAFNNAGQAVAIWDHRTELSTTILASTYENGVWSAATVLDSLEVETDAAIPPSPSLQIALNDQGLAVAVWTITTLEKVEQEVGPDLEVASNQLYAKTYDFAAPQWQQDATLLGQGQGLSPAPSLALADNGLAIVVWQQEGTLAGNPIIHINARGYSADSGCWCDDSIVLGEMSRFALDTSPNPKVAINESNGEAIVLWSLKDELSTSADDEFAGIWASHFSIPAPQ